MSNDARRGKRLFAGFLAAVMALSVAPVLGFTGVAGADEHVADPTGEGNFCEDVPMQEPFTDVQETDPSYEEIVCLVATEVTTGVTANTYEPNSFVTRRQMALFLTRVAAEADRLEIDDNINELPEPAANEFDDVEDEEQFVQDAISQVAQAEIAQGFPDGDYRPGAPVSRRQMAAFIDRLYEYLTGDELPATDDYFADDDEDSDEAQASTNAVAEAGIFIGNEDGTFAPAKEITRRQMANVLTRTFEVLFENDEITQWVEDDDETPIGPNDTFTDAPELVSVSQVNGDVVAFEFDEVVTGQALRYDGDGVERRYVDFRLYQQNGDVLMPSEARIEGDTVITRFPAVNLAQTTRAGVRYNAVEGVTGIPSIEGDYPFQAQATPGVTTSPYRPQLVEVGNYRLGDVIVDGNQEVLVDFTFNGPVGFTAGTGNAEDFVIVGSNSVEYEGAAFAGPFQTTTVEGNVTQTVVTVALAADPEDVPESQLRRGYVYMPDAEATEYGGYLILADAWETRDDLTVDPDLESIERRAANQFYFEFDEAVSDVSGELDASAFYLYTSDGTLYQGDDIGRSALAIHEARYVVVSFDDAGVLTTSGAATPVGGFVDSYAVRGTDNTAGTQTDGFNRPDEAELTLPDAGAPTPHNPGDSPYADLLRIERSQNPVTEQYEVSFVFDDDEFTYTYNDGEEDVTMSFNVCEMLEFGANEGVQTIDFDLYDENGTQFRADGYEGVACTTTANNEVIVTFDNDFDGGTQFTNEQIAAAVTGGVETDYSDADQLAEVDSTDDESEVRSATSELGALVSEGQEDIDNGSERGNPGNLLDFLLLEQA